MLLLLLLCESVADLCLSLALLQVEKSIPTPKRETEKPFLMPVEDTFSIAGRGTVVSGRAEQGTHSYHSL